MRSSILLGPLAAGALALPCTAPAQDYPSKPIRVIASSAAGGISDIFMRTVGEELHKRWGQPIVIENRAGGGMNIGGRACAEAPPDGYTICIMSNEVVTYNQLLYRNVGFDAEKSIAPVTNLFFLTQALAVNSSLKVKSLADLAALSKAKPGTLSYSAPAVPLALFMDNFNKENGTDLVRVPFKGGGDAVNNVLSGATPITFLGVGNLISYFQSGMMTGLVLDGERRSPLFPDIPTLREIGYRGPLTRSYFALYAPMGTPAAFVAKIADRHQADRKRGSVPRQASDRARARAGARYAAGVRAIPRAGSGRGETRRQGRRLAATVKKIGAGHEIFDAIAGLIVGLAVPSFAQDYPTRPIKAVTTTSAGGISDVFMRALGDELHKRWGQPIVVENRPGGMQNVGSRACTEAAPDGYTICILNAEPLAYNQFLLKNMPFDPEKGLQPVTNLYHIIQTLVVNAKLNVKTVDELIALSKEKPGTLNYLTAAVPLALYMDTLTKEKGADWVRVPFKGGGEAVNAVLSGSTPIALIGEGNVIGQIRAGTMTALAMVNNISRRTSRTCRRWKRPATTARRRAAGTACSCRPAPRSRSSTSSRRRSPSIVTIPPSASGISPRAAWCRRSIRRSNSPRRSRRIG